MKGIVLASHGNMALGMLQAASVFFGDNIVQIKALDFQITADCDEFEKEMDKAIKEVDSGDGVIVLVDLFAGTPAHKTTKFLNDGKVDVICGMNLPMLVELLGAREFKNISVEDLIKQGREGIKSWAINEAKADDDFF